MEQEHRYKIGPGELVPGADYFSLTLLMNEKNELHWSTQTQWMGFASRKPVVELREPSAVIPENMMHHWETMGMFYSIVSNQRDLIFFLASGGNALIEKELALQRFAFLRQPRPSRPQGFSGFVSAEKLPNSATFRAPSPKTRMKVMKRDEYRCKLCGRRAADHVDVELHVHHIRPWSEGGITLEDNLITLCHTCHKGLDPHYDLNLFPLIGLNPLDIDSERQTYIAGVKRYREYVRLNLLNEKNTAKPSVSNKSGD